MLEAWGRDSGAPTTFYIALVLASSVPDADTNLMSDLNEIAAGNGYTSGGIAVERSAVGWDTLSEDDANDRGSIQAKDIVWTASGGSIPSSGLGARYAVLTDDNGTVSLREVYAFWDLSTARSVSDGQPLTLQDAELRANES